MPGRLMSKLYLARPVALSGPSRRGHLVPMSRRFLGQASQPWFIASLPWLLHKRGDGVAHLLVGAAAADVAGQGFLDLGGRGLGVLVEGGPHGDDEAGRAEAALLGVVLDEGGRHGVELAVGDQGLGRLDLLALRLRGRACVQE